MVKEKDFETSIKLESKYFSNFKTCKMNNFKKHITRIALLVGLIIPATAQSQDYSFAVCLKNEYGKQDIETFH